MSVVRVNTALRTKAGTARLDPFEYVEPLWASLFTWRLPVSLRVDNKGISIGRSQHRTTIDPFQLQSATRTSSRIIRRLGFEVLEFKASPDSGGTVSGVNERLSVFGTAGQVEACMAPLRKFGQQALSSVLTELTRLLQHIDSSYSKFEDGFRYVRGSEFLPVLNSCKEVVVRHSGTIRRLIDHPFADTVSAPLALLMESWKRAIDRSNSGDSYRKAINDQWMKKVSETHASFFQNIESTELTPDQITAALTFDDANLTVAAAGSGKTSVIVAKAGFALHTGLFTDDEILVLAFNKKAAGEIRDRLKERVGKYLGRKVRIQARTFHSIGLYLWLKGRASTDKGRIRPKLVDFEKRDGHILKQRLVYLLQSNPPFAENLYQWTINYRYAHPVPDSGSVPGSDADLDDLEQRYHDLCRRFVKQRDRHRFEAPVPTLKNALYVRSVEEARIANWLYLHNVEFDYEKLAPTWIADKINPATNGTKSKPYQLDFTYPNPLNPKRSYFHEHFGLDATGKAPSLLGGTRYEERARHKRFILSSIDRASGTREPSRFIETRSADFRNGTIFLKLAKELESRGIQVGAEDRQRKQEALNAFATDTDLHDLISTFVTKIRSSGLSFDEVAARYRALDEDNRDRALSFLKWMQPFCEHLETYMTEQSPPLLDFAAMIHEGTKVLREGRAQDFPVKFVLVDEFQDIARPRFELVEMLLRNAGDEAISYCVGDDWQAINRFAGSDISIFRTLFKSGDNIPQCNQPEQRSTDVRRLSMTFRCEQKIAEIAREFVMTPINGRHPHIDKKVESVRREDGRSVRILEHEDSAAARLRSLGTELDRIVSQHSASGQKTEAFVLTRNRDSKSLPEGIEPATMDRLAARYAIKGLDIVWDTMHSSKGLGRDYVVLVGIDSGTKGFPRDYAQEPLISQLLPPQIDPWEEERRLFYVALTRAKRGVSVLCAGERPSIFVLELLQSKYTHYIDHSPLPGAVRYICPSCHKGLLRKKVLRGKTVVTCNRYPFCGYRAPQGRYEDLPDPDVATVLLKPAAEGHGTRAKPV